MTLLKLFVPVSWSLWGYKSIPTINRLNYLVYVQVRHWKGLSVCFHLACTQPVGENSYVFQ